MKKFFNWMMAASPCLRGVMAQNTFGMARKAVEAILSNAKKGEMVPTFYITKDNVNSSDVQSFLGFYGITAK